MKERKKETKTGFPFYSREEMAQKRENENWENEWKKEFEHLEIFPRNKSFTEKGKWKWRRKRIENLKRLSEGDCLKERRKCYKSIMWERKKHCQLLY